MKLGLIGYGKMGRLIAEMAPERGHLVVALVRSDQNGWDQIADADVCIEFSEPNAAISNIRRCAELKKNVVVGTTGWESQLSAIETLGLEIGILYSPNFSLGVNIWMQMVRYGAHLMQKCEQYAPRGVEVHHTGKRDAPSGTAKKMAHCVELESGKTIEIESQRTGDVCGKHYLIYESSHDVITISHEAYNRKGFAEGALVAAEWLQGKTGLFTFEDLWKERLQP